MTVDEALKCADGTCDHHPQFDCHLCNPGKVLAQEVRRFRKEYSGLQQQFIEYKKHKKKETLDLQMKNNAAKKETRDAEWIRDRALSKHKRQKEVIAAKHLGLEYALGALNDQYNVSQLGAVISEKRIERIRRVFIAVDKALKIKCTS